MSGYCAVGRKNTTDTSPRTTMMIERTEAKMGRSTKKRVSMGGLLSGGSGFRGLAGGDLGHRHGLVVRGDARPRPHRLAALDDDPFAGVQPLLDHAQAVVLLPQGHLASLHLVLVVDDVNDLLALVGLDRPV